MAVHVEGGGKRRSSSKQSRVEAMKRALKGMMFRNQSFATAAKEERNIPTGRNRELFLGREIEAAVGIGHGLRQS